MLYAARFPSVLRMSERWPSVTVIMAVLDEARVIDACFASLASQDYPGPWEVIVADGGSTDGTRGRLAGWEGRVPLRTIDNPGRRQSPGLNAAAVAAGGDILVRADGHTVYAPDYLTASVAALRSTGAAAVGGPLRAVGTTRFGRAVAAAMRSPLAAGPAKFHQEDRSGEVDTVYLGAFRRDDFLRLGGLRSFPSGAGEDADLYHRWRKAGMRVVLDPAIRSEYRPRETPGSLARQHARYGRAKAEMLWANRSFPSWRPMAPAVLVAALAVAIAAGAATGWWLPAALVAGAWAAALLIVAASAPRLAPWVVVAAAVMHLAYGAGLWWGVARGPRPVEPGLPVADAGEAGTVADSGHAPRVIDLADPRARSLLGGLPYSLLPAVDGQGRVTFAEIRGDDAGGLVLSVPDVASGPLGAGIVVLDRSVVVRRRRRMPAPSRIVVVSGSASASRTVPPGLPEAWEGGIAFVDLAGSEGAATVGSMPTLIERARHARLVVLGSFDDQALAARAAVHLAASGVLCSMRGSEAVRLLADRFVDALDPDLSAVMSDDLEWAAALARQTRCAWLGHDLRLAWAPGDGRWLPSLAPRRLPAISSLLVSMRPHLVPATLRSIAAQASLRSEVVVVLHGPHGEHVDEMRSVMASLGLEGEVFAVGPEVPFGGALDLGAARCSGEFIAKWDDDDLYGSHHLEDLVVAYRRSGADLVGKAGEFVHFAAENETIVRRTGKAEGPSMLISGGAMMMRREALEAAGGFPPIARAVDYHLRKRFRQAGLRLYRTHGFGYVVVRSRDGYGHTWKIDDTYFREQAERTWQGIPGLVDVPTD
jgi:succinoglycan biosynthesis protein ExoA